MKTSLAYLLSTLAALALEVSVRPDKICVKPREPVVIEVAVAGVDGPVTVAGVVRTGIDHVVEEFSATTDAAGTATFTFTPTLPWGYAAHITATAGPERAEAMTTFACSANPYFVAPAYGFANPQTRLDLQADGTPAPPGPVQGQAALKTIAEEVAFCRRFRTPVAELMGPAHCSFSAIKPHQRIYFKGKHYYYDAKVVRALIDALRDNGISSVLYVNSSLSSIPGYEFARQHPEYLAYTADGTVYGGVDTSTVDAHLEYERDYPQSVQRFVQDPDFRKQLTGEYPGCLNLHMDFRDLRLAEIAAEKIIAGQEYLGFDGVRYDGLYLVPSIGDPLAPSRDYRNYRGEKQAVGQEGVALSVRNLNRAFAMLREHDPDFLIGMNYASFRPDHGGRRHQESAMAKAVSPGVWVLDETTKHANLPTHPDYKWANFIANMTAQADNARAVGNVVFGGWGGGPGKRVVDMLQIASISWACGVVRIPGGYRPKRPDQETPYTDEYAERCRFVQRYSQFILDPNLKRVDADELAALVTVEGSRPVLWQPLAYRATGPDGRRSLVLNLVNAPVEAHITEKPEKPPVAENVRVTVSGALAAGAAADGVAALSPDVRPWRRTPTVQVADGGVTVTVPRREDWSLVVIPYGE